MAARYNNLLEFFDEYMPKVKYDKKLLSKFRSFRYSWGNKSEEYMEFLSNGLIGVYPIRFSLRDEGFIFKDILNIDQNTLQNEVYKVPGINKDFKISSNILNLTLVYFMHKFYLSPDLKDAEKKEAMKELYSIFSYKQIGSIYAHYFSYNVDVNLAQSVYEKLTNQYLIKKLGNWQAVFNYQAELLLPPNGNNADRIIGFETQDVVTAVNDMRNRISSLVKNVCEVLFDHIDNNDNTIKTTGKIGVNESGEDEYIDETISTHNYINTIKYSMVNVNDFVNPELVHIVKTFLPNLNKDKFLEALYYIVAIEPTRVNQYDYISSIIRTSLTYLRGKGIVNNYKRRSIECINKLKGYFSASKVKEADIIETKKVLENMIGEGLGTKTKWIITPIVIGICLYIFLRSIYTKE